MVAVSGGSSVARRRLPDMTPRAIRPLTLLPPAKGFCRLCGKPVNEPRRTLWHKDCNEKYHDSWKSSRERCWSHDHGICRTCVEYDDHWEADHIIPLHLGGTHEQRNLQTLCRKHHAEKTAKESTDRAVKLKATKGPQDGKSS